MFDVQILALAAFVLAVSYLVYVFVSLKRAKRPVDWEKDYPEYRHAKDTHVKVVK